jgi:hypothetical protein
MDVVRELLRDVAVPRFAPVRQSFDASHLGDVSQAVRAAVVAPDVLSRVREGARIAIGVGSRGVANLPLITRTLVELVRSRGADPFIVPAMGSHGGATACRRSSNPAVQRRCVQVIQHPDVQVIPQF